MSKAGLRGIPLRIGKYVVAMLPVAFAIAWLDHRFFPKMHSLWRLTGQVRNPHLPRQAQKFFCKQ